MCVFCIFVDKGIQSFGDNSAAIGDSIYIQYMNEYFVNQ